MTVRRFLQLVRDSDFAVAAFEAVPIRRLAWLSSPLTREFLTSVVKCQLVPCSRQARTEELATAAPFMAARSASSTSLEAWARGGPSERATGPASRGRA